MRKIPRARPPKDGQEEVYVVLDGDGWLEAGGTKTALARVGPSTKRKIAPGTRGIVLLVIGGTPGKAFTAK